MKRVIFFIVFFLLTTIILLTSCEFRLIAPVVISFQPDVKWGGRAVAVSVHPAQPNRMVAASESGGVFRSQDGGQNWQHMSSSNFWSFSVQDVEYCPRTELAPAGYSPIIATTYRDLSTNPNGGLWVAGNSALRFGRPASALPPSGARCPAQSSAYGISFDPVSGRAYVGTDCGYAWSDDCGFSWTHKVIDSSIPIDSERTQDRILNIVSSGAGPMYALGKNGIYFSRDDGDNWNKAEMPELSNVPYKDAPPRLAISPTNPNVAYLALDTYWPTVGERSQATLWGTTSGGTYWRPIRWHENKARQAIVLTTPHNYRNADAEGYTLYWGDGPRIFRAVIDQSVYPIGRDLPFEEVGVDHEDIQDIAFEKDSGKPLLLASDAGVHLTPNEGANWLITGGGIDGFNALQIYQVTGQFKYVADEYEHTDLYIGTHDNWLWYSRDGGRNWGDSGRKGEGAGIRMLRKIDDYRDALMTGYLCGNCYSYISDEFFGHPTYSDPIDWDDYPLLYGEFRSWDDAGDIKNSAAIPLDHLTYLQFGINKTPVPGTEEFEEEYYLYRSPLIDYRWHSIKQVDNPVYGAVKPSETDNGNIWLTFPVDPREYSLAGTRLLELRSISNVDGPIEDIGLYNASENFGSLGSTGYQFQWSPVFGVNPSNPNHIIAPDVISNTMKFSVDGGLSWQEDTSLTDLLKNSGQFDLFINEAGFGDLLVNEISFLPENPNQILIGTKYNGIIHSNDGGLSWEKLPLSERISHITSFFWDYPNGNVIVSSFGRGLWLLQFGKDYFDTIPNEVLFVPEPDPDRETYHWESTSTTASLEAPSMMNGIPMLISGDSMRVAGAGFLPSQDEQFPINLRVNGESIKSVFPDSEGRFEVEIPIILPDGFYTIDLSQNSSEDEIRHSLGFLIASFEEYEFDSNK